MRHSPLFGILFCMLACGDDGPATTTEVDAIAETEVDAIAETEDATVETDTPTETVPAGVVDPSASIAGKTYGEWADAWIQWYFAVPWAVNPLRELTGWSCHQNQTDDAFYLAGSRGAVTCNVPTGKSLVVPIFNAFWDNCGQSPAQIAASRAEGQAFVTDGTNASEALSLTVDGEPVFVAATGNDAGAYRIGLRESSFTSPDIVDSVIMALFDNPFVGVCEATFQDGVYVLLEPLAPGTHTVAIHSRIDDPNLVGPTPFVVDTTYTLVVAEPPAPLPLAGTHHGKSLAQWSSAWWQWVMGLPVTGHPLFDTTGDDCAAGQSGDVWFLGGTFGGAAERRCAVPAGKALFFPIVNAFADNGGMPPEAFMTEEELDTYATTTVDGFATLALQLDAQHIPLADLKALRVGLTDFTYTLPAEDSIYDLWGLLPEPDPIASTNDGIYVMLEPLPAGEHHIRLTAFADGGTPDDPSDDITIDVTYHLDVAP